MSEFDNLLVKLTSKDEPKVHGVIAKCVDKNGHEIYSKISGYNSVEADASPLKENAVFKLGSATKLITSIALLQCIERGLIGLDEPLGKIIPEEDGREILTGISETGELTSKPSKNGITARHLLTHTSGLGLRFLHPLLMKWGADPEVLKRKTVNSRLVPIRFEYPLLFEPGEGWMYGASLEWAGVVIRRLHDNMSLEDYFIENIWKKVGLSAPFPTFHISKDPEYKSRLMKAASRTKDGKLEPYEFEFGDNPDDQEGGSGMVASAKDYLAVLADLISDSPKLLKPETIEMMFTPQLPANSKHTEMLNQLRPAWDIVSGPISGDLVNHGLGGLLLVGETPEINQPSDILCWGGALNTVWFASKKSGAAGFLSTQVTPFGDPTVKDLVNAWKKEIWTQIASR